MKKITSNDAAPRNDYHFRIIPQTIQKSGKNVAIFGESLLLYIEKGMQVIGKTSKVKVPVDGKISKFPVIKNLFDFQITNQRYLQYSWSLYRLDEQDYQERVQEKKFSIKKNFESFLKDHKNKFFTTKVNFERSGYQLTFKLLIESTADTIMKLTAAILPQLTPSPSILQDKQLPSIESEKPLNEIQAANAPQDLHKNNQQQKQSQNKPPSQPQTTKQEKLNILVQQKHLQPKQEPSHSNDTTPIQTISSGRFRSMDDITNDLISGKTPEHLQEQKIKDSQQLQQQNAQQVEKVENSHQQKPLEQIKEQEKDGNDDTINQIKEIPTVPQKKGHKKWFIILMILFLVVGVAGVLIFQQKTNTNKQTKKKQSKNKQKKKKNKGK